MSERATANLQWKGTDACYDFYCPCGYAGADDENGVPVLEGSDTPDGVDNHRDGLFMQDYRCAGCLRWWHFSNTIIAKPGKFFHDDKHPGRGDGYGCADCETGHCS